jgi:hypothetical protein
MFCYNTLNFLRNTLKQATDTQSVQGFANLTNSTTLLMCLVEDVPNLANSFDFSMERFDELAREAMQACLAHDDRTLRISVKRMREMLS